MGAAVASLAAGVGGAAALLRFGRRADAHGQQAGEPEAAAAQAEGQPVSAAV